MAGSLAIASIPTNNNRESENPSPMLAIIENWRIEYARFINYRSIDIPSTHSSLSPLPAPHQKRHHGGVWISTSAASASLKLIYDPSCDGSDDAIIVVSLSSRILEEHRVSKMNFAWPQVSCVAGFPSRGSKAVFVSYKDDLDQIQKFALQFEAVSEAEKFMNILKELLENGSVQQLQFSEFNSDITSQAEVVPSDVPTYRPDGCREYMISAYTNTQPIIPSFELKEAQEFISADGNTQPIIPSFELNKAQESISNERVQDPEAAETMSVFPPSFTQLLMNCHPPVDQAKPVESKGNLKTQFMQYLQETSFQELMAMVESVISELGDDLML